MPELRYTFGGAEIRALQEQVAHLQGENEQLRSIIEKQMSAHWDMATCQCWFCVEARAIGCAPREQYLPHKAAKAAGESTPCPACGGLGAYCFPEGSGTDGSDGWYPCEKCEGRGR